MAKGGSDKKAYNREFIARTKWARECSPYSQDDMAEFFNVEQGTWKQYETRSPLPHLMVGRFCSIVRCDMYWLFTGKGDAPEMPPVVGGHSVRRLASLRARRGS